MQLTLDDKSMWVPPGDIGTRVFKKPNPPVKGSVIEFFSKTKKVWIIGKILDVIARIAYDEHRTWLAAGSFAKKVKRDRTCYKKGDMVEAWSNSKRIWLDGMQIERVLMVESEVKGLKLPAGAMLVNGITSTKWIMPTEVQSHIRKIDFSLDIGDKVEVFIDSDQTWAPGTVDEVLVSIDTLGASMDNEWISREMVHIMDTDESSRAHFALGESVEVWSQSRKEWSIGIIEDICTKDTLISNVMVAKGSIRVCTDKGFRKWIKPADISSTLKRMAKRDD